MKLLPLLGKTLRPEKVCALVSNATYADAMFNLALLLQRVGNHVEAADWWRRYLTLDQDSPWASRAKRALKFCEMQMARS